MRIIITGSTGRVGANLAKRLSDAGHDIIACLLPNDKDERKLDDIPVRKAYIDVLDKYGIEEAIKGSDVVIHAAAVHESSLLNISAEKFFDINVKGMFNVLESIRDSGNETQLICLSSAAVYDVFSTPRVIVHGVEIPKVQAISA
jgi:nucleoside-diphosphate-sugar epimerase